jgi:hypothetical protein
VKRRYLFLTVIEYTTVERCSVPLIRSTKKMLFSSNDVNEGRLELQDLKERHADTFHYKLIGWVGVSQN